MAKLPFLTNFPLCAKEFKMEKQVENLEALFQKADSDIDKLTQRLDFEFENNDEVQVNPAQLMKKLDGVKKDYESLTAQHAEIEATAQTAVQEFRVHLNDVLQLLMTLQSAGGAQLKEKPPELDRLEEMLGTKLPWADGAAGAVTEGATSTQSEKETPVSPSDRQMDKDTEKDRNQEATNGDLFEMSPTMLRQNSDEFIEVTEAEFNTVSELIRGRVKLAEVNSVYKAIWNSFKTDAKSKKARKIELLTPADMHKLGLKVSGNTGQAKLKVLRALKLLRMTTKGEVALI